MVGREASLGRVEGGTIEFNHGYFSCLDLVFKAQGVSWMIKALLCRLP